jgi:hypothetical protein
MSQPNRIIMRKSGLHQSDLVNPWLIHEFNGVITIPGITNDKLAESTGEIQEQGTS